MRHSRARTGSVRPSAILAVPAALLVGLFAVHPVVETAAASASATVQATPPFPRPAGLEPAIGFWTRIYGELDSDTGLIHDDRRLDRVYRTLYLNPGAPHGAQEDTIRGALSDYREALLRLASGKRTGLNAVELTVREAWGDDTSSSELEAAAERVRFQRGQADRFREGLSRSRRWRARIRAILESQGLPAALAALPHVESSYNPQARSKAGAAGLWQFMPATARRFLRVDETLDERLDPYRSTQAAALLLKQNHSVLKSWPLAITAYNHGLSGVRRAQRETGTSDLYEIIRRYRGERFGFASRNFYAAFLAAVDVAADPETFSDEDSLKASDYVETITPAYLPVDVILVAFGIERSRLRSLNPKLHHAVWNGAHFVPKDYPLRIPARFSRREAEEVLGHLSRHFGFGSQRPYGFYEVRLGDSVSVIAHLHDTSVAGLVRMNGLTSADDINAGQRLRVPMGPVPEPLGAGSAAMLRGQLERGELNSGAKMAADVPLILAVAAGLGYPGAHGDGGTAPEVEPCGEAADAAARVAERTPKGAGALSGDAESGAPPDLPADPADYRVAADGSIEIQIAETMGHYADWLGSTSDRLRERIDMEDDTALIVGRRLKLDFSDVGGKRFEQHRIAFHERRQQSYFDNHRITGVLEHRIQPGDNLWILAEQQHRIPLWLLRQYNPDVTADTVLALDRVIQVPLVEKRSRRSHCLAGLGEEGA